MKTGALGFYRKGERSSLNQYYRQFLLIGLAFFYQIHYVERLKIFVLDFGGRKAMEKGEYISASGNICVTLKRKAEWSLEVWANLILHY